jgi:hypothetical protein
MKFHARLVKWINELWGTTYLNVNIIEAKAQFKAEIYTDKRGQWRWKILRFQGELKGWDNFVQSPSPCKDQQECIDTVKLLVACVFDGLEMQVEEK